MPTLTGISARPGAYR